MENSRSDQEVWLSLLRKISRSNLGSNFGCLSCCWLPAVGNISVDQQTLMETIWCDTLGCHSQHSHSVTRSRYKQNHVSWQPSGKLWSGWSGSVCFHDFIFPGILLNLRDSPSVFHCSRAATNLSWSREGDDSDYIRSCDYVAWLPFFMSCRHIVTNLNPFLQNRSPATTWPWLAGNLREEDEAKRDGQKRTGVGRKKRDKMNGDRNIRWQSDKEDEGTF